MANVMADKFWTYWTVTVPSILPVMGIVGAYGWTQSLKNRLATDEVRLKSVPKTSGQDFSTTSESGV
jgi:hypothetical protein